MGEENIQTEEQSILIIYKKLYKSSRNMIILDTIVIMILTFISIIDIMEHKVFLAIFNCIAIVTNVFSIYFYIKNYINFAVKLKMYEKNMKLLGYKGGVLCRMKNSSKEED